MPQASVVAALSSQTAANQEWSTRKVCVSLASPSDLGDRPVLPAIYQALLGSRDLTFGLATYRPGHAGYNNRDDVARIAAFLQASDPTAWTADHLVGFAGTDTVADREDELAFAREWLVILTELYTAAGTAGQVVILVRIF